MFWCHWMTANKWFVCTFVWSSPHTSWDIAPLIQSCSIFPFPDCPLKQHLLFVRSGEAGRKVPHPSCHSLLSCVKLSNFQAGRGGANRTEQLLNFLSLKLYTENKNTWDVHRGSCGKCRECRELSRAAQAVLSCGEKPLIVTMISVMLYVCIDICLSLFAILGTFHRCLLLF